MAHFVLLRDVDSHEPGVTLHPEDVRQVRSRKELLVRLCVRAIDDFVFARINEIETTCSCWAVQLGIFLHVSGVIFIW